MNLTPKQQVFIDTLLESQRKTGVSPTYQELADALGVSKVSVFETVERLELKGAIRRDKHASRSLQVVEAAMRWDGGKALSAARTVLEEAAGHELPPALQDALRRLETALPG